MGTWQVNLRLHEEKVGIEAVACARTFRLRLHHVYSITIYGLRRKQNKSSCGCMRLYFSFRTWERSDFRNKIGKEKVRFNFIVGSSVLPLCYCGFFCSDRPSKVISSDAHLFCYDVMYSAHSLS